MSIYSQEKEAASLVVGRGPGLRGELLGRRASVPEEEEEGPWSLSISLSRRRRKKKKKKKKRKKKINKKPKTPPNIPPKIFFSMDKKFCCGGTTTTTTTTGIVLRSGI
jgi:hypothetical protein